MTRILDAPWFSLHHSAHGSNTSIYRTLDHASLLCLYLNGAGASSDVSCWYTYYLSMVLWCDLLETSPRYLGFSWNPGMHLSWHLHSFITKLERAAADGAHTESDKNAFKGLYEAFCYVFVSEPSDFLLKECYSLCDDTCGNGNKTEDV